MYKRQGLPITGEKATPLSFRSYKPFEKLEKGAFGTLVPSTPAQEIIPLTLIIPLLGFTIECSRIGYGGGYYDATIASLSKQNVIHTIGFAFECQKCDSLPIEDHDKQLDMIITECGIYRAKMAKA